jgi:hypothetical protein
MSHEARAVIEEMLGRAIYHWRRGSRRRGSRQRGLARHYVDLAVELHRSALQGKAAKPKKEIVHNVNNYQDRPRRPSGNGTVARFDPI